MRGAKEKIRRGEELKKGFIHRTNDCDGTTLPGKEIQINPPNIITLKNVSGELLLGYCVQKSLPERLWLLCVQNGVKHMNYALRRYTIQSASPNSIRFFSGGAFGQEQAPKTIEFQHTKQDVTEQQKTRNPLLEAGFRILPDLAG